MTILLYKDGRLVIDDGNPIEGNSLEGLVACVSDPQSGDTLKFDGKQWVAGAAASGLPDVSGDDDGKVLTVVDGAWAPAAGGGGGSDVFAIKWVNGDVLDKTAGEIVAAIEAGKRLVAYNSSFDQYESWYSDYQVSVSVTHPPQGTYEFSATLYYGIGEGATFTASSVDAYPAYISD